MEAPTLSEHQPADSDGESASDSRSDRKQACNRCRQRKIRCNRAKVCSNCVRSKSECFYPATENYREKRQRIHVSAQYEEKIDRIIRTLDEIKQKVDKLSDRPISSTPSAQEPSFETQSHSSSSHDDAALSKAAYEGESSLSAHALFASQFLKDLVCESGSSSEVVGEMASALDTLHGVIDSLKQQRTTLQRLYPHAKPIPQGLGLGDLRVPPVEISLECLQKAKECPRVQYFWLTEFVSLSQFTDYLVNLYSPGPRSTTDMIIVLGGLFWLFCECALMAVNEQVQERFWSQAVLCRETLETIVYNLPFHNASSFDSVLAMSIAASYCFRMGKASAAWNFITTASQLCQTLGFHHPHVLSLDSPDLRQRKVKLLWSIYIIERMLSLRLGRSSTFHDNDITLPPLGVYQDIAADLPFNPIHKKQIHIASLYGRTYNEIYSLGALAQPVNVRITRAIDLAAELKRILDREDDHEKRYNDARRRSLGDTAHELFQRASTINDLTLLTLIYRGVPPKHPSKAAFGEQCIATAREALEEHEHSINILSSPHLKEHLLEVYINWSFLIFPFFPFIVLFCHVAETSEQNDLHSLRRVVETLESITDSAFYQTCSNQIHLFRALYNVVEKYIEVKTSGTEPQLPSWNFSQMLNAAGAPIFPPCSGPLWPSSTNAVSTVRAPAPETGGAVSYNTTQDPDYIAPGGPNRTTSTVEIDEMAMELGNWFHGNHEMLRFLDDSYLQ